MFVNGVRTGMEAIVAVRRPILQDLHQALTVFFVAAAGSSMRGTAECLIVAPSLQAAVAATTACALSFRHYNYIT